MPEAHLSARTIVFRHKRNFSLNIGNFLKVLKEIFFIGLFARMNFEYGLSNLSEWMDGLNATEIKTV